MPDLLCSAEEMRNCHGKMFDDDAEVFSSLFSTTQLGEACGMAVIVPGWLDSKCFEINRKTCRMTLVPHCSPRSFPLPGSPKMLYNP